MALFQLIYMSALVVPDVQVMSDIVATSTINNKRDGITGMLLYSDGDIVQVLEGPEQAVKDTFCKILVDKRHVGIQVLLEQKIALPEFGSWSIGYKKLEKGTLQRWTQNGEVFNARDEEVAMRVRPGNALSVLKSFAQ